MAVTDRALPRTHSLSITGEFALIRYRVGSKLNGTVLAAIRLSMIAPLAALDQHSSRYPREFRLSACARQGIEAETNHDVKAVGTF